MRIGKWVMLLVVLLTVACSDSKDAEPVVDTDYTTYKIAVVLPLQDGQDVHWRRTLQLCADNLQKACSHQKEGVKIELEWYDELGEDIAVLAKALAEREDIVAVIGGQYSAMATVLASKICVANKPLFTIATSGELSRAYALTESLWAMTETDITQCEVLLSKVMDYGNGIASVALLADRNSPYGKTFVEWFGFIAEKMDITVKGIFSYEDGRLDEHVKAACESEPTFLVCAPSSAEDLNGIEQTIAALDENVYLKPKRLYSDVGYSKNVLSKLGGLSEGLRGVCYGADPESGFDVSYEVMFGELPSAGDAQVYDALMVAGYALFYKHLNPEVDLNTAIKHVVADSESAPSRWLLCDMQNVIDQLAAGDRPNVWGASGTLSFDSKVYTNVLSTVYYDYEVYNGRYIVHGYTSNSGASHSSGTLVSWEQKSGDLQEFGIGRVDPVYPELDDRWALLVAASSGWNNYRHQADVLNMYQILKSHGYGDDHIVLVMEDDIAYNPNNPQPGVVRVRLDGENLYRNVRVDYHTSDLQPRDIKDILCGVKSDRLPEVIDSDADDNVLVFWSGHGAPGQMVWLDDDEGFTSDMAKETFAQMHDMDGYRKILCLVETCYGGSVMQAVEGIPGLLALTAANANETSKADIFSYDLNVWMSNRFTYTLQDCIAENPDIPLRDLYYRLFINTVGSHVMLYNEQNYGNIYRQSMGEYLK